MKRSMALSISGALLALALLFVPVHPVIAQTDQPQSGSAESLLLYTQYPSQMIGFGEVVTVPLKLRAGEAQVVTLSVRDLPEGWEASFRGGSKIVDAVYVDGENEATVDLRLEPPESVEAGRYEVTVLARGDGESAELPLAFTVAEKLPPRLSLNIDGLPTKRGTPKDTTTFTVELVNDGGEDLVVRLSAVEPKNVRITFQSGGQDVTELELAANETKSISVRAQPLVALEAGRYPITVQASAGDVSTELELVLEIVGEGDLTISTPDGRLSGQVTAGQENPLKVVLRNNGTAPLRGIELSSTEPSGWSLSFNPEQIAEIPAGGSAEVDVRITPPDNAVAGDYMVTIRARPVDMQQESAEFRITVRTSTLWGVAGIALIALAVGVVGIAVVRFGRR